jgi:hypothetical protein
VTSCSVTGIYKFIEVSDEVSFTFKGEKNLLLLRQKQQGPSKRSVSPSQTARCNIAEDSNLHSCHRENRQSRTQKKKLTLTFSPYCTYRPPTLTMLCSMALSTSSYYILIIWIVYSHFCSYRGLQDIRTHHALS